MQRWSFSEPGEGSRDTTQTWPVSSALGSSGSSTRSGRSENCRFLIRSSTRCRVLKLSTRISLELRVSMLRPQYRILRETIVVRKQTVDAILCQRGCIARSSCIAIFGIVPAKRHLILSASLGFNARKAIFSSSRPMKLPRKPRSQFQVARCGVRRAKAVASCTAYRMISIPDQSA